MWKIVATSAAFGAAMAFLFVYLLAQSWFLILILRVFAWSAHLPWPPGGTLV